MLAFTCLLTKYTWMSMMPFYLINGIFYFVFGGGMATVKLSL
jgi:hypothetical protein